MSDLYGILHEVAQGAMDISACPYMSDDAMAQLSELPHRQ